MDTGFVPEAGDIIVVPQVRESHLVYVVHVEGGTDQLKCRNRADAIAQALASARCAGVNAFYGEGPELGFVLLGHFREAA
jgi:hypothetical protein